MVDRQEKREQLDALNKLYIYYACVAENTVDNFLKALHYRKKMALITGNLKMLNEVKEAYRNIEKERQKVIKHRNRASML